MLGKTLLSSMPSSSSVSHLNVNEILLNESDMLSFQTALPAELRVPQISYCEREAEKFIDCMKRNKETARKLRECASIDENRYSLSQMPPAPPVPLSTQHDESAQAYTMNLDIAISLVEIVTCILRGSKIESFDLTGLHSNLSALFCLPYSVNVMSYYL